MNHDRYVHRQRIRRAFRVRKRTRGVQERPRLSVCRSLKHIYVQVIDDSQGRTLASASTLEKELRSQVKSTGNRDAAELVGKAIAQRAKAVGVERVCLDRGSHQYHGRVAALAEAARSEGLQF